MTTTILTFEQFQASGFDCNLQQEFRDTDLSEHGRAYANSCYIEKTQDGWYLIIERSEYVSKDLAELEAILYRDWYLMEASHGEMTEEDRQAALNTVQCFNGGTWHNWQADGQCTDCEATREPNTPAKPSLTKRIAESQKFDTPAKPSTPVSHDTWEELETMSLEDAMFARVMEAIQPAEELGGLHGYEYVQFMSRIVTECNTRIANYSANQLRKGKTGY